MRLTLAAIVEKMNEMIPVCEYYVDNPSAFIQNVLFMNAAYAGKKHTVFIYEAASGGECEIPDYESAVICIGPLPEWVRSAKANYICVGEQVSAGLLFNQLSVLMEELRVWEARVYDYFIMGRSLQDIFNISTEFTHNPIYLHDENFHILAYAETGSNPEIENFPWMKGGKMPDDVVDGLMLSDSFRETFNTNGVQFLQKGTIYPDLYNYLYCNIRLGNRFIGRIIMDERNRPLRQMDYLIVEKLAEIVTKLFETKKMTTEYHLDYVADLFISLMEHKLESPRELEIALSEMGWQMSDTYQGITIPMTDDDNRRRVAVSILNVIERVFPACYAWEYKNSVIAVLNKSVDPLMNREKITENLTPMLKSFGLQAFVSNEYQNILDLPDDYRLYAHFQANRDIKAHQTIYFFEDHAFDYILDMLLAQAKPYMLYPKKVQQIMEYDAKNGTDYLETLRAYVANDCSPAIASQVLYIHRSTFRYRLEKMEELFGIHFQDPKQKAFYMLAFQLMDHREESPFFKK